MNDQDQNNDDFSEGFLIKDKSGQLKKVQDDKVVDFKPATQVSQPSVTPVPKKKEQPISTPPPPPTELEKEMISPDQVEPTKPATWPLSPQAPISSSSKAAYIVEPEDEEEIKKHREELAKMTTALPSDLTKTMGTVVNKVIQRHNLSFSEEVMQKRFSKIIESRLKNIRDSIETEEVLTRAKKIGGLGLTPEAASNIIRSVEEEAGKTPELKLQEEPTFKEKKVIPKLEEIPSETGTHEPESMLSSAPPPFIPIPKMAIKVGEKEASPPLPKTMVEEEATVVKPKEKVIKEEKVAVEEQVSPPPAEPVIKPELESKPVPRAEPASTVAQPVEDLYQQTPEDEMAKIAKVRKPESQRPQVVDIKRPASTIGPVEELGEIDLTEFRRLGTNPTAAAEKILEKVYLLEEESWQMRMDGIEAWRHSPVHQLYVATGMQSIESGQTIKEVIQTQSADNKPSLHMEEFKAINDLNSKLIA